MEGFLFPVFFGYLFLLFFFNYVRELADEILTSLFFLKVPIEHCGSKLMADITGHAAGARSLCHGCPLLIFLHYLLLVMMVFIYLLIVLFACFLTLAFPRLFDSASEASRIVSF